MKRKLALFSLLMIALFVAPASAGAPMSTVEANVNSVLDVLRDPALKPASAKEIKKERLRVIYDRMFNQVELSRRTLGRNWAKLSAAQQKEFVQLYRQLLENTYIDRILAYKDEKIVFDKEAMLSETQAEVQTRFISPSKVIPVVYRMILQDGSWRVYDVVVENVSLVQNYRTQFNDILAKNTPDQMLDIVRKKVKA